LTNFFIFFFFWNRQRWVESNPSHVQRMEINPGIVRTIVY
jgi:hypothetical protein